MHEVAPILHVPLCPHPRFCTFVVPALRVDAIQAEDLQLAAIDFGGEQADHSAVFIVEKPPHGGWENQKRHSRMTEDQGFHIALQFVTVSLVVFPIHFESEESVHNVEASCTTGSFSDEPPRSN